MLVWVFLCVCIVYLPQLSCIYSRDFCDYLVLFFCQVADSPGWIPYDYIPTAHTCSNVLVLPIGSLVSQLPQEQGLFQVYDLAFANNHLGTM